MPRPSRLSRFPLTIDHAVLLSTAAAGGEPALVLLVLDDDGILLAVRHLDLSPTAVEEQCDAVIRILARTRAGPVVLVSVLPSFGTDAEPHVGTWHELRRRAAAFRVPLIDWLLVDDRGVASVRVAARRVTGGCR